MGRRSGTAKLGRVGQNFGWVSHNTFGLKVAVWAADLAHPKMFARRPYL